MGIADDLLETIRQSDLHEISSADDLVKHIVLDTVTFPDKFKWAGLGEHILDIFEGEAAIQHSGYANKPIHEAAKCIWEVKDIRDELRLIRKVFEKQLEVVKEFVKVYPPQKDKISKDCPDPDSFREAFIRNSGLEALIQRVKHMDEDAAAILEGVSVSPQTSSPSSISPSKSSIAWLSEYAQDVKNSKPERARLLQAATQLNSVSQHVQQLLQSPRGPKLHASRKLAQAMGDGKAQLFWLEGLPSNSGRFSSLMWSFQKKKVDGAILELERCTGIVHNVLQVDVADVILKMDDKAENDRR
ncbi:hypothetical protein QQZ08_012214 [Neonectria magnoliae]|uniref:Uncharacterized protein n=1 Tax=Neonectria magnoliae TaxID=2732573 RepID=A0ABR1H4B3_9HYPO